MHEDITINEQIQFRKDCIDFLDKCIAFLHEDEIQELRLQDNDFNNYMNTIDYKKDFKWKDIPPSRINHFITLLINYNPSNY